MFINIDDKKDRKKRYFDIYSNQTNIDGKKKEERKRKRYLDISIDRYRSDANDKGIKKTKDEVTERDDVAEGRARGSSVLK